MAVIYMLEYGGACMARSLFDLLGMGRASKACTGFIFRILVRWDKGWRGGHGKGKG